MRNFILGVIVTVLVLAIGFLGLALLGFLPTRANSVPPKFEVHLAMSALDNSVDRQAPHTANPVPITDDNLIEGLKIYTMNCALCHGGIDLQHAVLAHSFYPPAPSLLRRPPDDPEWHTFYVIRNGVRYTGMPAWDKALPDSDIWKVTAFLSRVSKLPPAVQDYWKKAGGTVPSASADEQHEHHEHEP